MNKFLDQSGLAYFWGKIKASINGITADQVSAANKELSNLADYQRALANLGVGVQDNLIDNAYAAEEILPINQKGSTLYSSVGHAYDRWNIIQPEVSIEIESDGIIIKDSYLQNPGGRVVVNQFLSPNAFEKLKSSEYATISALISEVSGEWYISFDNYGGPNALLQPGLSTGTGKLTQIPTNVYFWRNSTGPNEYVKFTAAKFEGGDRQTLGFLDDSGSWKMLPQHDMDHESQLQKCYPYLINYNAASYIAGAMYTNTDGIFSVNVPTTMRTTPVISQITCNGLRDCTGASIPNTALSFSALRSGPGCLVLKLSSTQPVAVGPAIISDLAAIFDASL